MISLFLNALIGLYGALGHNLTLAIIALTVVVKALLAWPSARFIRSQKAIQELQPRLTALRERHKNNRQALAKATMDLYRSSKVNPFSSCLPMLIQLPILIILYQVFLSGIKIDPATHFLAPEVLDKLYPSIRAIVADRAIDTLVVPGLDLASRGVTIASVALGLLAGALQFWQTRMLSVNKPPHVPGAQDESLAAQMTKQMTYLFPVVTVVLVVQFPAGLGIYWATSTAFSILQQWFVLRTQRRIEAPAHASHAPPP